MAAAALPTLLAPSSSLWGSRIGGGGRKPAPRLASATSSDGGVDAVDAATLSPRKAKLAKKKALRQAGKEQAALNQKLTAERAALNRKYEAERAAKAAAVASADDERPFVHERGVFGDDDAACSMEVLEAEVAFARENIAGGAAVDGAPVPERRLTAWQSDAGRAGALHSLVMLVTRTTIAVIQCLCCHSPGCQMGLH